VRPSHCASGSVGRDAKALRFDVRDGRGGVDSKIEVRKSACRSTTSGRAGAARATVNRTPFREAAASDFIVHGQPLQKNVAVKGNSPD